MQSQTPLRRTSAGPVLSKASHAAILEAAEAILCETGSGQGFTMEAVAKRAQAGKPTLYRRWKSKGELFLELFETRIVKELPTVEALPDKGSVREDLAEYMERCWSGLTRPKAAIARAFLQELDADLQDRLNGPILQERRREFEAIMQRGVTRGEIAQDKNFDAAWDLYIGFNISRLTLGQQPDPTALRRAASAIAAGVRQPPTTWTSPPGRDPSAPRRERVRLAGFPPPAAKRTLPQGC